MSLQPARRLPPRELSPPLESRSTVVASLLSSPRGPGHWVRLACAFALFLSLSACRTTASLEGRAVQSSSDANPSRATSEQAARIHSGTEPSSDTSATRSTEPTPSPGEVLEVAQRKVERLSRELERLRGLKFKEPVQVEVQSADAFSAFVKVEIDRSLPVEVAARQSRALQALGLLPPAYDLRAGMLDMVVSQAGAYYNPETRTFYILMAGLPEDQLDALIIHELQHALQDQYFDLKDLQTQMRENPNEDTRSAIQFVLEGEATYVMMLHQLSDGGHDVSALPAQMQRMVFGMMRDAERDALVKAMNNSMPSGKQGEALRASMEAVTNIPPFMFWGLYDPYMKGQFAVYHLHALGGWNGVGMLYARTPTSTEQLLHPDKLLDPRDEPTALEPPTGEALLGPGWTLAWNNTLGEAGISSFFDQHLGKRLITPSEGWDGDVYALYEGPASSSLLGWWSVWDTDQDALEFAEALRKLTRKSSLGPGKKPSTLIRQEGAKVLLLAGAEPELERALRALQAMQP